MESIETSPLAGNDAVADTGYIASAQSLLGRLALAFFMLASMLALAEPAQADESTQSQPVEQSKEESTDVWHRAALFGDIGGLRPWMARGGVSLDLSEISEYLYNTRGGLKTGGVYDGVTNLGFSVDTAKAFGLQGGLFHASALQIHGRDLGADYVGSLNTPSGNVAQRTTRLWQLWYQQSFLDDRVSVKVGQQSADEEFITSFYAGSFIGTTLGWPGVPSYDMPSGGPAFPLASLGMRVNAQLAPGLTGLVGVFDGDPLGNNPNNIRGTNFNLKNGTLTIAELQYSINQPAEGQARGTARSGLPGTYKLGFWYNNANPFNDQFYDTTGLSLANPGSSGNPRVYRNNYSWYAVADQMIWRPDPERPRSIGVFARVMGAPGSRNLVGLSANTGVVMTAPFEGRDDDTVGIAVSYIKIGNHAHRLALQDAALTSSGINGVPYGAAPSETALELTYNYQVAPWWIVQGDVQYIRNTGADRVDPNNSARTIGNSVVVGVRTKITF